MVRLWLQINAELQQRKIEKETNIVENDRIIDRKKAYRMKIYNKEKGLVGILHHEQN